MSQLALAHLNQRKPTYSNGDSAQPKKKVFSTGPPPASPMTIIWKAGYPSPARQACFSCPGPCPLPWDQHLANTWEDGIQGTLASCRLSLHSNNGHLLSPSTLEPWPLLLHSWVSFLEEHMFLRPFAPPFHSTLHASCRFESWSKHPLTRPKSKSGHLLTSLGTLAPPCPVHLADMEKQ